MNADENQRPDPFRLLQKETKATKTRAPRTKRASFSWLSFVKNLNPKSYWLTAAIHPRSSALSAGKSVIESSAWGQPAVRSLSFVSGSARAPTMQVNSAIAIGYHNPE